jgi:DNA-binding MarR family transcriptional regulator
MITMTSLSQPERVAVARLQALLELLPTALDRQLQSAGVTAFEYALLEALAESETKRLRLSALASRTNATLARLSRVVTSLERKGFVERVPCPADARATNAVLTAAGERAHAYSRDLHADAVRALVLDALDPADLDDLSRVTLAILTKLDPEGRLTVTAERVCAADPVALAALA